MLTLYIHILHTRAHTYTCQDKNKESMSWRLGESFLWGLLLLEHDLVGVGSEFCVGPGGGHYSTLLLFVKLF